jgi:hypothetical protein
MMGVHPSGLLLDRPSSGRRKKKKGKNWDRAVIIANSAKSLCLGRPVRTYRNRAREGIIMLVALLNSYISKRASLIQQSREVVWGNCAQGEIGTCTRGILAFNSSETIPVQTPTRRSAACRLRGVVDNVEIIKCARHALRVCTK